MFMTPYVRKKNDKSIGSFLQLPHFLLARCGKFCGAMLLACRHVRDSPAGFAVVLWKQVVGDKHDSCHEEEHAPGGPYDHIHHALGVP